MIVRVRVTKQPKVLDPEARVIVEILNQLPSVTGRISSMRIWKEFELELTETDLAEAKKLAEAVAKDPLANPVTEIYEFIVKE